MNYLDWTQLGGMPFTQNRQKWLQDANMSAFASIAKLCGDKSILYGIQVNGGNVSSGWFSYGGELIEFVGGSVGTMVKITTVSVDFTYANAAVHGVQFQKTATCGPIGDFPFADLIPITSLVNMWVPGDIKEKFCDNAYISANFDVNGYGINREKGWRIFSKVVPASAGKTFVNVDTTDADFDTPGKVSGEKTHTLTRNEQGAMEWRAKYDDGDDRTGSFQSITSLEFDGQGVDNTGVSGWTNYRQSRLKDGTAAGHNNVQPSFAILKLIKL